MNALIPAHSEAAALAAGFVAPKSKAQLNREKYAAQAEAAKIRNAYAKELRKVRRESKTPAWGSQQWAETRGDDLGLSADY